jgi:hypothetical protein
MAENGTVALTQEQLDVLLAQAREEGKKSVRVMRGNQAITNAPTRDDLPIVEAGLKDKSGMVIDRWIVALLKAGFEKEAGAVGNLYNKLVRHNLIAIPEQPCLPYVAPEPVVESAPAEAKKKGA